MMTAQFTQAVRYTVTAVCKTPLRTGNGDLQDVLKDVNGVPFIQGSSLAGALRSWLERENADCAARLFGGQEKEGHLIVSDGHFDAGAEQEQRPRLRISQKTGCADKGAKFDIAHMGKDSAFTFILTWLGRAEDTIELAGIEQMLAALHTGEIQLGAQKSNGFGRVVLSVRKRIFDLYQQADREAWLDDAEDDEPVTLPMVNQKSKVKLTVVGKIEHILVKASSASMENGVNIIKNMEEQGQAILPASSIKGAVRARASVIAAQMGLVQTFVDSLFGRGAQEQDNGKRGRVSFEDVMLSGAKQKISRIRINKFTGGVMRRGLFTEEPYSCQVEVPIWIPQEEMAGCGLVLYALRDLGLGLYNFGSGGSVGHGFVQVDHILAETPSGAQAKLCFDENRQCTVHDPNHIFEEWMRHLEEEKA